MQLARVGAVARTDVLIRVRRPASIAVFLALCAFAYMVVPPLSSGRTLMQVDGHRAFLSSATIALATAGFDAILIGMIGFYLVSNTIRRDLVTRTGYVIAGMPVTNAEYLAGKFLGNTAFLGLVALGSMVNVMGMHLLRAEGPLQPLVYLSTYAAVMGPALFVISAFALLFESVRPLSGRVGDVLYFFVWIFLVAIAGTAEGQPGISWHNYVDPFGMLFMIQSVGVGTGHGVMIGGAPYDPANAPWAYPGIPWSAAVIWPRVVSALLSIPVLLVAWVFFARFDPAKMKGEARHARRNIIGQLNRILKPVTRLLLRGLQPAGGRPSVGRIALSELTLTFMLSPIALALAIAFAVWGTLAPIASVRGAVLPAAFFAIIIAIGDIATRDDAAGMTALLYSMPKVRPWYVAVKFLAAAGAALAFTFVPLVRIAIVQPPSALSLVIGVIFVAALAVSLGTLTGSSKTFAAVFLLFMYLVMSAKGAPSFDFAGMFGVATNGVRVAYLVLSGTLVVLAAARHRMLQRG
jgi:hypothetical protein